MRIDIDRLHNVKEGRYSDRRCGKTFAMTDDLVQTIMSRKPPDKILVIVNAQTPEQRDIKINIIIRFMRVLFEHYEIKETIKPDRYNDVLTFECLGKSVSFVCADYVRKNFGDYQLVNIN